MLIRDCVHSGLRPFGIASIQDCVHSGWCPFGMVSIRDGVHSGWCPFGMVSIRDDFHLGWCPFGMVSIPDGVHSGLCPFGIVSIRDCVHSGNCPDTQLKTAKVQFDFLVTLRLMLQFFVKVKKVKIYPCLGIQSCSRMERLVCISIYTAAGNQQTICKLFFKNLVGYILSFPAKFFCCYFCLVSGISK